MKASTKYIPMNDTHTHSHGVPSYIWMPPATLAEFQALPASGTTPTVRAPGVPSQLENGPNEDPGPDGGNPASMVPHPLSDFSHIDPGTPYFRANEKLLNSAPGFRRLETLFNYLLHQVSEGLDRFNQASEQEVYEEARTDYLE